MKTLLRIGFSWLLLVSMSPWGAIEAQQSPSLPRVIPPSPDAASLFRFLDYPVSNATGVPDISIPVYEVKSGPLRVPIALSYHAGGRRITDETGAVGVGWTLQAGGMIARTVYGQPDETASFPNDLRKVEKLQNDTDYDYLKQLSPGPNRTLYDTEYDIYSYQFGAKSGKFVYSSDRDSIYLLSAEPVQFEINRGIPITALDEQGTLFRFNQPDVRATTPTGESFLTGRLLTAIISADKQDTISFGYRLRSRLRSSPNSSISIFDDNQYKGSMPGGQYPGQAVTSLTYDIQYTGVYRLTAVRFREGWLRFNHAVRYDQYSRVDTTDRVESIELLNRQGKLLKTIRLEVVPIHSYQAAAVTLSQLLFQDTEGKAIEKYAFDYYDLNQNGGNGGTGTYNSRDFWGYCNGYLGNELIPSTSIGIFPRDNSSSQYGITIDASKTIGGAYRGPNAGAAKLEVLRRITYPTGGSTEFQYEGNVALRNNTRYETPGLRVSQITTTDNITGKAQVRTFRYGEPDVNGVENGCGQRAYLTFTQGDMSYETRYFPDITNYTHTKGPNKLDDFRSYRKRTYTSEFLPGIAELANEPTYYATVTEYLGTSTNQAGKIVYRYSPSSSDQLGLYKKLYYWQTLPLNPDNSQVASPFSYLVDGNIQVPFIYQHNQWQKSQLVEKTEYKYTDKAGVSTYQPIHYTGFNYQVTPQKVLRGVHIYKNIIVGTGSGSSSDEEGEKFIAEYAHMPVFSFSDYYVATGRTQLVGTTEKWYENTGTFTTTTTNTYNDRLLLRERQQTTSTGKVTRTVITYPFETRTLPVHEQMTAQHLLDYPVQQRTYTDQLPLTTTHTQYRAVTRQGTTFFTPSRLLTATGTGPLQSRQHFDYWDARGNVTERHQASGVPEAYQWGYRQRYPIAQVINARNQQDIGPVAISSGYGTFQYDYASTRSIPATLPAQTFTSQSSGPVTLQLAMQGNQGSSLDYPRAQPLLLFQCYLHPASGSGFAQTYYIKAGGPCSSVSASQDQVTFANVPRGTYVLEVTRVGASISPADCFEAQGAATLNYSYQVGTPTTTGFKEFYVENFEENPTRSATTHARTGDYGSDGNAFTIPFTPSASRTYVLDWQQWENGRWVYHREPYTGKTFASGTYVDDIRVYPTDAQITTFTYAPLIGPTSSTDTNGRSTHYEYDTYGRLLQVRDNQGTIVRRQQYHYRLP